MDEGRPFSLPVASGWTWDTQAKSRDAASCDEERRQIAADEDLRPAGEPATPDIVTALIAARDAERDRVRRLELDIRLLVGANKALRREVLSLQVRGWRDQETIAVRDRELGETRQALEAAIRRGRQLAQQVRDLHSRRRLPIFGRRGRPHARPLESAGRLVLAGPGSLLQRGFLLGEASALVGTAVQRIKSAPSGTMIFGPYIKLMPGTYAVAIAARLYQRLPVVASFGVEIVCDRAQHVIDRRRVWLHSIARSKRVELVFTVWDGEDHPDFEIRIWARKGTPLEIGGIELCQMTTVPQPASIAAAA